MSFAAGRTKPNPAADSPAAVRSRLAGAALTRNRYRRNRDWAYSPATGIVRRSTMLPLSNTFWTGYQMAIRTLGATMSEVRAGDRHGV